MPTSTANSRRRPRMAVLLSRCVAVLLAVVLGVLVAAGPVAAADDARGSGEVTLTDAQKKQALEQIVPKVQDQICKQSTVGSFVALLGGESGCRAVVTLAMPKTFAGVKAFSDDLASGQFCQRLGDSAGPVGFAVKGPCDLMINPSFVSDFKASLDEWWKGFAASIGSVLKVVKFITNPALVVDEYANSLKTDSVNSLGTVLNSLSVATDFDPGAPAFRQVWAAGAGLGLIVLTIMVILALRSSGKGETDGQSTMSSIVIWAPIGVLAMVFGPPLGVIIMGWLAPINEALITWGSGPANSVIQLASAFAAYPSSNIFGPWLGMFLWGGLLAGTWAVVFLLVLWKASLYLVGVGIAVALGMFAHPKWRPRALKLLGTFAGIILSKTALLFLLGAGLFLTGLAQSTGSGPQAELTNIVNLAVVGFILIMVTFFPVLLLKYLPLTPAGAPGTGGSSSGVGAAVMAGSATMLAMRMGSNRANAVKANPGGQAGWNQPAAQTQQKGAPGPNPASKTSGNRSGDAAMPGVTPNAATAARPLGDSGGAGGGSRGSGRRSAAGATGSSGGASLAGAGTAVAAQAVIAAGSAAAAKVKEAASDATPEIEK